MFSKEMREATSTREKGDVGREREGEGEGEGGINWFSNVHFTYANTTAQLWQRAVRRHLPRLQKRVLRQARSRQPLFSNWETSNPFS